jgi:hypothetical protein
MTNRALAAIPAAILLVAFALIAWWQGGEAPVAAVVGAPASEAPRAAAAPAKGQRIKVYRPAEGAEQPAAAEGDPLVDVAHGELSEAEKARLSQSSGIVGEAIQRACLAPALVRSGGDAPLEVSVWLSVDASGIHSVEILHDGGADEELSACLDALLWELPYPGIDRADGLYQHEWTFILEPDVAKKVAQPVDVASEHARTVLGAVLAAPAE